MLVIATDEAGYGPKLGPLVIVSTAWRVPGENHSDDELHDRFAPLRATAECGDAQVVVDDSKAIFSQSTGLDALHAAVSASCHWCGLPHQQLSEWIGHIAADDTASLARAPWLEPTEQVRLLDRSATRPLLAQWAESGAKLVDVQARIITAEAFNDECSRGGNKADLLSASSVGLVHRMIERHGADESQIAVYCDRHGGRRYYAAVVQHVFPDAWLQIMAETKTRSSYRLTADDRQIDIHFTVKGDSFTPVALSSIHAKYLRERLMESFNRYFTLRHDQPHQLTPTAGYPVDADRFLSDITPILDKEKIEREKLVRSR